jgi:hypothetical protein
MQSDVETRLRALERAVRTLQATVDEVLQAMPDAAAPASVAGYRVVADPTMPRTVIAMQSAPAEPRPAAPATYWQGEMLVPDAPDAERAATEDPSMPLGDDVAQGTVDALREQVATLTQQRDDARRNMAALASQVSANGAEVARLRDERDRGALMIAYLRALCGEAAEWGNKGKYLPFGLCERLTAAARGEVANG